MQNSEGICFLEVCTGGKDLKFFIRKLHFGGNYFFKMKNDEYDFLILCSVFHLQAATLSCCPDVGWWALSESCGTEKSGVFLIQYFKRLFKSKEIHSSAPLFYGTVLILGLVCLGRFCLVLVYCWWFFLVFKNLLILASCFDLLGKKNIFASIHNLGCWAGRWVDSPFSPPQAPAEKLLLLLMAAGDTHKREAISRLLGSLIYFYIWNAVVRQCNKRICMVIWWLMDFLQ